MKYILRGFNVAYVYGLTTIMPVSSPASTVSSFSMESAEESWYE